MTTNYSHNGRKLRYVCNKQTTRYAGAYCQSMAGKQLDEAVQQLVLASLEPAALELSLQIASDIEAEQKRLTKHWEQRLERARIDTERAYRQYDAVEPENRLVTRTLESRWEAALTKEQQLKQEFEDFLAQAPILFGKAEQEQVRQMAQDIPSIWAATTTTARQAARTTTPSTRTPPPTTTATASTSTGTGRTRTATTSTLTGRTRTSTAGGSTSST